MDPLVLVELLRTAEFRAGLGAGLIAAAVGTVMPARWRRFIDGFLFMALAGGIATGFVAAVRPAAVERAWALGPQWLLAAAIAALAAAWGLRQARTRWHPSVTWLVSLGGVWATTPDTELSAVLLGASIPMMALMWLRPRTSVAWVGALAATSLAAATVLLDGAVRPSGLVGGLGSLAALALMGLRPVRPAWLVVGWHVVIVVGWSRIAGLAPSATRALTVGVGITAVAALAEWWTERVAGLRPRSGLAGSGDEARTESSVAMVEHRPEPDGADDDGDRRHDDGGT